MFKKKHLFISSCALAAVSCASVAISCSNISDTESLKKLIDSTTDVNLSLENINQTRTNKIIETLLNSNFKDQAKKVEFLKTQQSKKHIEEFIKKANELKEEFLNAYGEQKDEVEKKLLKFYSDNWYIVLKNINKFTPTFYKWLTFPAKKLGQHSQEYLDTLYGAPEKEDANLQIIDASTINYLTNYIDEIDEGEESAELGDSDIFYLTKGLTIFRVSIYDTERKNPRMHFLPYVWAFPESRSRKISARYVSHIAHNALIHGYQAGFDEFEQNMVKKLRYGRPAKMMLLLQGGIDEN